MKRKRRAFVVRDEDGLIEAIDQRVARARERAAGRRVTREGVVREILRNWLQLLGAPKDWP